MKNESPLLQALKNRASPKETSRTLDVSAQEAMGYPAEVGSPMSLDVSGYVKEKRPDGSLVLDITFCELEKEDQENQENGDEESPIVTTQESHVP